MKAYIIPFLFYVGISYLNYFGFDQFWIYFLKVLIVGALLYYFRKDYKLKIKFDPGSIGIGLLIFIIWIGIDSFYPHLGSSSFNPYETSFPIFFIVVKVVGMMLIASIVEELFTRSFLIRVIIEKSWEKVKIGTFTWLSFIVTVLFFGFAHERWLAGIITGIILNLWLYKKKDLFATIIAHSTANLALAVYVLATNSWLLW